MAHRQRMGICRHASRSSLHRTVALRGRDGIPEHGLFHLDSCDPRGCLHTGLFPNYANDSITFLDSAGSSLLAYSAFRLASIGVLSESQSEHLVRPAERIYQAVQGGMGTLGNMTNGIDVINVLSFNSESAQSSTWSRVLPPAGASGQVVQHPDSRVY